MGSEWEVINGEIERNRGERINWRGVFGVSLSKVAADFYAAGEPWEYCFSVCVDKAADCGIKDFDSLRKLKVSICSMYAKKKT